MSKRKVDALIDIRGVDRFALLKQLWLQQKPAIFFSMNPSVKIPEWNDVDAREALNGGYIDYLKGRCIKTDLSTDFIDPYQYNWGRGPTFEEALYAVKEKSTRKNKD